MIMKRSSIAQAIYKRSVGFLSDLSQPSTLIFQNFSLLR